MGDLIELGKFIGALPPSTAFTGLLLVGYLCYVSLRDRLVNKHDALAADLRPQVIRAVSGTESNTVRVGDIERRVTSLEHERREIVSEMQHGHTLIMGQLAELKRDVEANTILTGDLDKRVAVQQEWIADQRHGGGRPERERR